MSFTKNDINMRDHQLRVEIVWLENEVQKLANQYDKRQSVIHQITEYQHQIRERELNRIWLDFHPRSLRY